MTISSVSQPDVQVNLNKLINTTKVIGQYIGDSANPGLVPDADAAVVIGLSAIAALGPTGTAAVVTDAQTVTGVTGTGSVATLHVASGALTITLGSS